MRSNMKYWMTLACLSTLGTVATVGCAEGSPSQPPIIIEPIMDAPPPTCGNGKVDTAAGEQCDCGSMVSTQCQVMEMDCMAVNRGPGTLLCKAAPACTFNFSMCAISTPASNGGSGAVMPGGAMPGGAAMPGGMMMRGGTGGTGR
jgi:hypothetical protein